jgi:hypothetical protein
MKALKIRLIPFILLVSVFSASAGFAQSGASQDPHRINGSAQRGGKKAENIRTVIRVPSRVRSKMKDLSAVLQMVKLTPLVNDAEEVVGVELNEISEKDIINVLKARNGDVVKEVRVFRKVDGKVESTTYPVTSAADVMGMYSALLDANSVEVNLKRGKSILPMTYVLE